MGADTTPLLECVTCHNKYSEQDVLLYNYFPQTRRCFECYEKDRNAPYKKTCFGKRSRATKYGYDSMAIECKTMCADRKVCIMFVKGTVDMKRDLTEEHRQAALSLLHPFRPAKRPKNHPFRPGSLIYVAFEMCRKGTTKTRLQKYFEKHDANVGRALRVFRVGHCHGIRWDWKEQEDRCKIEYPVD